MSLMDFELRRQVRFAAVRRPRWVAAAIGMTAMLLPVVARADACDELRVQKQRIQDALLALQVEYPLTVAAVQACVESAQTQPKRDRDAALAICLAAVCATAGKQTCTEVSKRVFDLALQTAQRDRLYEQYDCASRDPAISGRTSMHGIFVTNACEHPISVAVRYRDTAGKWVSDGWWSFTPGEKAYLDDADGRLQATASTLYYYAVTTDKSALEWRGDLATAVDGRSVGMRQLVDASGDTELTLTCN